LPPEVVEYVEALLREGHYVMIVTNATISKRFDEFATFPAELTKRLFFKFSYHYLQLKERGLLDTFFRNVKKMRDIGCSFTLEITPSDELIPYISECAELAVKQVGALPHVTVARDERVPGKLPILTNLSDEEYVKTWSVFDSELFRYKKEIFNVKRREFCYAGDWSFWLNLGNGNMSQCYCSYRTVNILDNPDKPIPFHAIGNNCSQEHCYNGHAFLVLGNIPELSAPTYGELRNRVCRDGSEWLKPEMKRFMDTHLWETNAEYTDRQKQQVNAGIERMKRRNRRIARWGAAKRTVKSLVRKVVGRPSRKK